MDLIVVKTWMDIPFNDLLNKIRNSLKLYF